MTTMNNLFAEANNNTIVASSRNLPGTTELTTLATRLATSIIKTMETNIDEYTPRIQESAVNNAELEKLINELIPDYEESAHFLNELDDSVIDGMLKSQQSKRSRAKSKTMTLDNYHSLMSAAIAEKIIREVTGRAKQTGGRYRKAGAIDYTGAQLEELEADQEALRREIRNIQSKKSIMKSKADFDESDERWIALVKAEQQLKDLRVNAPRQVVEVDTTKNALAELLGDVDTTKLNSKDAHALLESITAMLNE